jgi:hypothetical protein
MQSAQRSRFMTADERNTFLHCIAGLPHQFHIAMQHDAP